jgi:hypothetical protein
MPRPHSLRFMVRGSWSDSGKPVRCNSLVGVENAVPLPGTRDFPRHLPALSQVRGKSSRNLGA